MEYNRILLTGMMGSGKTTIGRALGQILLWPHVDTDSIVAQRLGLSIDKIFETLGENTFRQLEVQALQDVLLSATPTIVSTGGGTMCSEAAWSVVTADVLTVWLDVSPAVMLERLVGDTTRPLLTQGTGEGRSLTDLMKTRRSYYERSELWCDATLPVSEVTRKIVAYGLGKT